MPGAFKSATRPARRDRLSASPVDRRWAGRAAAVQRTQETGTSMQVDHHAPLPDVVLSTRAFLPWGD